MAQSASSTLESFDFDAVESDPAQIDVVVRLSPRRQGHSAMDDGLGLDDLQQAGPVGSDVSHGQPVCRVPSLCVAAAIVSRRVEVARVEV